MLSLRRPYTRVVCVLLAGVLAAVAAVWVMSRSPTARAASTSQLQQQISQGQSRISQLSGALSAASNHLANLNNSIASLQNRIARIQSDLDAKRNELLRLRDELSAARTRLASLEAFEAHAETVLSQQLVSDYETDRPDIVSVVLEAHGFQDLLEPVSYTHLRAHET